MNTDTLLLEQTEREALPFGQYVSVCWNIRLVTTRHARQKVDKWVRDEDEPYVDFPNISKYGDEYYEREDSMVEGGLSLEQAEQVYEELGRAIAYLRKVSP